MLKSLYMYSVAGQCSRVLRLRPEIGTRDQKNVVRLSNR